MGEQHVPLQINEEGLVTKVGHDMGGSYEYTTKVEGESYDNCVLCGKVTAYKTSTHIDFRTGYIEGAGQLCQECYTKGSPEGREYISIPKGSPEGREYISIPKHWIKSMSNDMELGAAVRKFYYDNY